MNSIQKKKIFSTYGTNIKDTGSTTVQIALFTFRIKNLSDHLKNHKKDFNTERALVKLVGKRKKLLKYIEKNDIDGYRYIIKKMGLRK